MPTTPTPEVTIGSFNRPEKVEKKNTTTTAATTLDKMTEVESSLEQQAKEAEDQLKPMESYEEALKKEGVSKEEAASIVDDVLMKGFYSETISITSRISMKLRTRNYSDTLRVNTALEVLKPVYQTGYDELVYRYTLAASLESFGQTVFKFASAKDPTETQDKLFEERLKFIETLPEATVLILFSKLTKFDRKIRTVLKEGAIENF